MRRTTYSLSRRTIVNFVFVCCASPIGYVHSQLNGTELRQVWIEVKTDNVRLAKRDAWLAAQPIRTLKGSTIPTSVRIREVTERAKSGVVIDAPGDMVVDSGARLVGSSIGSRFLLFLSKNQYPLRVLRDDEIPLNDGTEYYTGERPT